MTISAAYQICKQITFRHAKTFYFASHFIPVEKRNACFAVYAFCRYVDDLVDVAMENGILTVNDAVTLCTSWQQDLERVYNNSGVTPNNNETTTAILLAWEDTLTKYSIPRNLPFELIEGVLMDTTISRFSTFEELRIYCYKVASVVGLMTSEIFGYSHPDALGHAIDLGIALQLTNIIRDVEEDSRRNRIYLPNEDLQKFGVSELDILNNVFNQSLAALIHFQIERAEHYYVLAQPGIKMLSADSRITVQLMSDNYRKILRVVERMNYNVFEKRASTAFSTKILSIPKAWVATR